MRTLLLAPMLAGCAYRVTITSTPTPAEVVLPDGRTIVTPRTVKLRWVPFGQQRVTAYVPGHRPLEVDLRRTEIRWWRYVAQTFARPRTLGGASRGEVRLVLVPDHGPAGTWTAEEIP